MNKINLLEKFSGFDWAFYSHAQSPSPFSQINSLLMKSTAIKKVLTRNGRAVRIDFTFRGNNLFIMIINSN